MSNLDEAIDQAESDPIVAAIDEVSESIVEDLADENQLLEELDRVRNERLAGRRISTSLGRTGRPRIITLAHRLLGRISRENAHLRHTIATALVKEGEPLSAIAVRFGVSRQRVGAILNWKAATTSDPIGVDGVVSK